ncbi:hypothetical protein EW146_g7540 [Bondarzewia mesenterica]|uniref:Uncharacterized protein n=1 Tax=Bondarzewia mesenterica TaxID=1095465 RepID=A0A4S4LL42_9AGAM|nr:hypothetical protein EW146_g7540 [Bondarzewia mesenterica]
MAALYIMIVLCTVAALIATATLITTITLITVVHIIMIVSIINAISSIDLLFISIFGFIFPNGILIHAISFILSTLNIMAIITIRY